MPAESLHSRLIAAPWPYWCGPVLRSWMLGLTIVSAAACSSPSGPAPVWYLVFNTAELRNSAGATLHGCMLTVGFEAVFPLPDSLDVEAAAGSIRRWTSYPVPVARAISLPSIRIELRPGPDAARLTLIGPGWTDPLVALGGTRDDLIYFGDWTCDQRLPLGDDPALLEAGYPVGFRAEGRWNIYGPRW